MKHRTNDFYKILQKKRNENDKSRSRDIFERNTIISNACYFTHAKCGEIFFKRKHIKLTRINYYK